MSMELITSKIVSKQKRKYLFFNETLYAYRVKIKYTDDQPYILEKGNDFYLDTNGDLIWAYNSYSQFAKNEMAWTTDIEDILNRLKLFKKKVFK